jgi:hypothetical protein
MKVKLHLYLGRWLFQEEEFILFPRLKHETFQQSVEKRTAQVNQHVEQLFSLYQRHMQAGIPMWVEIFLESKIGEIIVTEGDMKEKEVGNTGR